MQQKISVYGIFLCKSYTHRVARTAELLNADGHLALLSLQTGSCRVLVILVQTEAMSLLTYASDF